MCGICGIVDFKNPNTISKNVLGNMTKAMEHRGPDEQGTYLDAHVGLGSRRLSIIDLAGGRSLL